MSLGRDTPTFQWSCTRSKGKGGYSQGGKRFLDIVLAIGGLALFTIPMAWIALRIRWQLKKSPLFRQMRVGLHSNSFCLLKFRTMSDEGNPSPFGRWLRKTAMDELPQLINILRGQMSFVGPRPLIPEDLEGVSQVPSGERRFLARPGLTGLAQLNAPKTPSLAERIRWDCSYVDRCSFWLDLNILLKSLRVTLQGAWGS